MKTEKSDVYSICGGFIEDHTPSQIKFFGGFFSIPREDSNFFGSPFNGSIVDCYGDSTIKGNMTCHSLEFDKQYTRGRNLIKYDFKMTPEGIWIGKYTMQSGGAGMAFAKTSLDWGGIEMLIPEQSFNPLRNSENLVERLLREGRLIPGE